MPAAEWPGGHILVDSWLASYRSFFSGKPEEENEIKIRPFLFLRFTAHGDYFYKARTNGIL
jgi:hypothetical protein